MSGLIGHRGMLLRGSIVPIIQYRGAGAAVNNNTGTTVSLQVPPSAQVGDLLVAVVMRWSDDDTPPSGWTSEIATAYSYGGGGTTYQQALTVFTKSAEAGDLGTNVTFAQITGGSNRLDGRMYALYCNDRVPEVVASASAVTSNTTSKTMSIPSASATSGGQLAMVFASSIYTDPSNNLAWTFPGGWTARSATSGTALRTAAASQAISSGQSTSGTITLTRSGTSMDGQARAVLIFG